MLSRLKRRSPSGTTPERQQVSSSSGATSSNGTGSGASPLLGPPRYDDDESPYSPTWNEEQLLSSSSLSSPTTSLRRPQHLDVSHLGGTDHSPSGAASPSPHSSTASPDSSSASMLARSPSSASSTRGKYSLPSAGSSSPPPNMPRRKSRSGSVSSYIEGGTPSPVASSSAAAAAANAAAASQQGRSTSRTFVPGKTKGASNRYLVVNKTTAVDESLDNFGSGSLSLDHLTGGASDPAALATGGATWVARAPELINLDVGANPGAPGDPSRLSQSSSEDNIRTPMPGDGPTSLPDAYFGVAAPVEQRPHSVPSSATASPLVLPNGGAPFNLDRLLPLPASETSFLAPAERHGRARSHTTSEAPPPFAYRPSTGIDTNLTHGLPPSSLSARPNMETTPRNSVMLPNPVPAADQTAAAIEKRPTSRSSSVTSSDASIPALLRPPLQSSPTSSFKLKRQKSAQGIAGAIAASGMALAATGTGFRQAGSLSRTSTRTSFEDRGSGAESDGGVSTGGGDQYANGFNLGDYEDAMTSLGTGYAVASSKRNAEFHQLFKNIPDDDYLIEDYGCALQREILIQGRLYISEHHISFNANIFGWVTSHTLPFAEIVSIEKRTTAYVIPNAIQIVTLHARHTFASFLSRDSTYDLICNIWRMIHPVVPPSAALPDSADRAGSVHHDSDEDEVDDDGSHPTKKSGKRRLRGLRRRGGTSEERKGDADASTNSGVTSTHVNGSTSRMVNPSSSSPGGPSGPSKPAAVLHAVTTDMCPTHKDLKEVCMDVVFPSAPEKIYNLMFTSGFMRTFWTENQKLMDLQISDWAPEKSDSNLLARNLSYIKPLSAPIGPKQTKCMILDETAHVDFDDYVCVITTTRTPDVPSGGSFAVKTRTSMTWARNNSCRVVVTTGVVWTGRSMLKGIIERSCIEGQKTYHVDLEDAMRAYIQLHRSEFLEEGQEPISSLVTENENNDAQRTDPEESDKDDDPNEKSASAHRRRSMAASTSGIWGIITDAFSDLTGGRARSSGGGLSPTSLILALVILILVLSNLWTLSSRPRSTSPSLSPGSRRSSARSSPSTGHDQTPDQIADAIRDVLRDYLASLPSREYVPNDATTLPVSEEESSKEDGIEAPSKTDKACAPRETADIGQILDGLQVRLDEMKMKLKG
ncbi:BZ3500_MvSof-1268-A1-R1_Chr3-1g05748 [Microbotryum saponariae]|uniref:BZ3500_MvSof-1268-A1-R1_Chr3-1g05748 protein n=1 Tax=Microbotryum saponariae TaxID=289078 RepID=A0A2X0LIP7_9BASI|nr:BZ3500_MvSof-1268-A1-R1_Chr3-1g05748 [Microbotryum saponariae]SDA04938.1 BZ3501_MvSof-1269-A2-R1_Chr3-1g05418 [Microbotryum saponariae]